MTKYTAEEIRANRRAWIAFLREPGRKKTRGSLAKASDPEARCCLGHACVALGLEGQEVQNGPVKLIQFDGERHYAPESVVEKLGLWARQGRPKLINQSLPNGFVSLANWNDGTGVTPAEIADYLEEVIEGGPLTPFKPL